MAKRAVFGLSFARKLAALAIVGAPAAHAQVAPAALKFEVASIKPCAPGGRSGVGPPSPGRLTVNCFTVMGLIRNSYIHFANGNMTPPGRRVVIEKGPAWIDSDLYTIEAKAESTPGQGTMLGPMMQALLEDRFKLKIHAETRDVPVYALTAGKAGSRLQVSQAGSCVSLDIDHPPPLPQSGQPFPPICKMARITSDGFDVRGVTLPEFCLSLSGRLDRDVIDKTGIAGTFDFHVALAPGAPATPAPPPPGPAADRGAPASPNAPAGSS